MNDKLDIDLIQLFSNDKIKALSTLAALTEWLADKHSIADMSVHSTYTAYDESRYTTAYIGDTHYVKTADGLEERPI